jgi:hypothetical protein
MARQVIWKSIAQTTVKQLIAGYSELIQRRMKDGSNVYFLSLMFKPLAGSPKTLLIKMNDEVQRKASLPFLITVPDRPVSKQNKQNLSDLVINNGLHLHGILCVPRNSRLKVDAADHFDANKALYVRNRLLRIDIKPVYSADVVDYAFKSLKNGNASPDDIQVYH